MKYLNKILEERSTWDGVVICGCCAAVILFGELAKIVASAGLLYGVWTLLTPEK